MDAMLTTPQMEATKASDATVPKTCLLREVMSARTRPLKPMKLLCAAAASLSAVAVSFAAAADFELPMHPHPADVLDVDSASDRSTVPRDECRRMLRQQRGQINPWNQHVGCCGREG